MGNGYQGLLMKMGFFGIEIRVWLFDINMILDIVGQSFNVFEKA